MSGGKPDDYISLTSSNNCARGSNCLQFNYRAGGGWGGIFWWPPQCGDSGTDVNWAKVKSCSCCINLNEVTGFRNISSLKFWARGSRGGERIEFKIGASDIRPIPGKSIKVTLTTDWQQYTIDLSKMKLDRAVGLFAWIASDLRNPRGATFYLDEIQLIGIR